jgi:hypothetical protein
MLTKCIDFASGIGIENSFPEKKRNLIAKTSSNILSSDNEIIKKFFFQQSED